MFMLCRAIGHYEVQAAGTNKMLRSGEGDNTEEGRGKGGREVRERAHWKTGNCELETALLGNTLL